MASLSAVAHVLMKGLEAPPAKSRVYPVSIPGIPMQYPLTVDEKIYAVVPASFSYSFGAKTPLAVDAVIQRSPVTPLCRAILGNGNVQYTMGVQIYTLPLRPTADAPPITAMLDCNPWSDIYCKWCGDESAMYLTSLVVRHPYMSRPGDPLGAFGPLTYEQVVFTAECMSLVKKDCGVKNCTNGQYASDFPRPDADGYSSVPVRCLPCKPGTWLTCITGVSCIYNIPSTPGDPFVGGSNIYSPYEQTPVGGCFACELAGGGKQHYGTSSLSTYVGQPPTDPLPWYCPGGAAPPVVCPRPFVGSDPNHTTCACSNGWYRNGDGCVLCRPGYMCPGGVALECPDHTYQDAVGASECVRCTSDGTATGAPMATCLGGATNNARVLRKCVGRYKAEPPQCVSCNMCIRDYVSSPAGQVDCYL